MKCFWSDQALISLLQGNEEVTLVLIVSTMGISALRFTGGAMRVFNYIKAAEEQSFLTKKKVFINIKTE